MDFYITTECYYLIVLELDVDGGLCRGEDLIEIFIL